MHNEINLEKDNPTSKAVISLVEKLGIILPEKMKETPLKIILTGGAAMSFYSDIRVSNDVDAIFSHRILLPTDVTVSYTDRTGNNRILTWDAQYHPSIGLLHEDAEANALFIANLADDKIKLMILNPVDLAVTKIGRYYEHDKNDIIILAKKGLIDDSTVEKRAKEALGYYIGNTRWVEGSIRLAVEEIKLYQNKISNIEINTQKPDVFTQSLQNKPEHKIKFRR